MYCHCCGCKASEARKVKIRLFWRNNISVTDVAAAEATKYRWSFVCQGCYAVLDNYSGMDEIRGRVQPGGELQGGKATTVNEAGYRKFLQREAAKLGGQLHEWLAWEGGTVVKLARGISDDADFQRLPILADALEEAGCADRELLFALRFAGPHYRACWAVDLLLLAAESAPQPVGGAANRRAT